MSKPLVSVITPLYNGATFLKDAVQSVLAQSYENWELIIIDDASTDESYLVAQALAESDNRITVKKLSENLGAGNARNQGLAVAKGDYIAFLDADDIWKFSKLEKQIKFMKEHDALICYSDYDFIAEDGTSLHRKIEALPKIDFTKLLKANYIGNLTAIYNASVLGKEYFSDLRVRQDWGMWLKLIQKAGYAYGISESLATYRVRKGSISANKWNMLKYNFKVYNEVLNFSFLKSTILLAQFLWEQKTVKNKQIKYLRAK
ncbi:glycosyltransferase family 2 protein [Leeuwenhoekiella sp. A16]|uniref:glycosyltransferase family 2 protein n=1 Tax=unclassified Leeuwenhoekiella TaxID=2615029 RepID=UPI003A80C5DE